MFFPPRGINEMDSFVSPVETILHERAEHAMLLVGAVEERANMTTLAESTPGKLLGFRGGLHLLTFTQRAAFSPAHRFGTARSDPACSTAATGRLDERTTAYYSSSRS
jgi:hypothetical protein